MYNDENNDWLLIRKKMKGITDWMASLTNLKKNY